MSIKKIWKHKVTSHEGNCRLFGINIFNYDWIDTDEVVQVYDPIYGQPREADVYKVCVLGIVRKFAALELSYGMWGFYLERYTFKQE